jgi:hypothetical protein
MMPEITRMSESFREFADQANSIDRSLCIVVDESVSFAQREIALQWLAANGVSGNREIQVAEQCRGAPDGEIMRTLLNEHSILVTTDRVFHNRVLAYHLRSIAVIDADVTDQPLALDSSKARSRLPSPISPPNARDNHRQPPVPFIDILIPHEPKALKNLRQRRRRIRNYFDGLGNIAETAVTVSALPDRSCTIVGIHLRARAYAGLPALDATESYFLESVALHDVAPRAVFAALLTVARLHLHGRPVRCFYDAVEIADVDKIVHKAIDAIMASFHDLQFIPVTKGVWLDRVRSKLISLMRDDPGNELRVADHGELMRAVLERLQTNESICAIKHRNNVETTSEAAGEP